jgi:hypothetical protein
VAARVLNLALLFLLGVLVGTVGTVAQQSTITVAGVPLPWGLALGLIAVGCLLAGVRLVTEGRSMAIAAALGIVAPIVLFSFTSQGGSVLIPENPFGLTWVVAPVVLAGVIVAWPATRARRAA